MSDFVAHPGGKSRLTVLRIFGPKRERVTGIWRKLRDDYVYNPYAASNNMMIKLRGIR
jgi:hypothetical protein